MQEFTLLINQTTYQVMAQPNWTLLRILRDELCLMGSKFGCGTGHCGACKVLVDGEACNSCMLAVSKVVGKSIITIEGLSGGEHLHPVQQAFVDAGAIQCGYCTPGMVITTVALLNKTPNPGRAEILSAFSGNLCRCTGYSKIIGAVQLAAKQMQGGDRPCGM